MKRNILNVSVISLLALASTGAFVACNDYDDDIDSLKSRVDANEASIAANTSAIESIRTLISSGSVITSVQKSTTGDGGIVITLSNGTSYTISNGAKGETGAAGADGQDAKIWTIESTDNGYFWACDGVVTEYPAQGADGKDGADGASGTVGTDGKDGADGKDGVDGTNGDYYIPNATTGKFDKVNGETGEVTATDIQWLGAGLTAVDNGSSVTISGLADAEGNALDAVVISKTGLLRGIVFVPDLYLNGVEATRFASATFKVGKAVSNKNDLTGTDNAGVAYTIAKTEIASYEYLKKTAGGHTTEDSTNVISNQDATVKFNLNPSEANIKDIKFSFTNINDVESITTKADETPVPSISVVGEPSLSNGVLSVGYKLENGDALKYDGTLPVTSLVASLPDNSNISSNYFTITTSGATDFVLVFSKDKEALYTDGATALTKAASIDSLVYNQTLSLPEKINVQYSVTNAGSTTPTTKTITLDDALSQWGLSATYEKFNYTLGDSKTSESDYIAINNGVINVRYATTASNGSVTWQDVTGTEGRSAIGKHPAVRVTLSDASKNVVAVGFIKLAITDPAAVTPDPTAPNVFVIGKGSFDYLSSIAEGSNTVTSNWDQMSGVAQVLGNITKDEFVANYTVDASNTYATDSTGYVATDKYGSIVYNSDSHSSTNAILTWTYSQAAAKNIRALDGSEVTLYKKFTHTTTGEVVYLGFTITINAQPSVKIGNVQAAFRVNKDAHHVFMSTPQAQNGTLTVKDFYKEIPTYYDYDETAKKYQPVVYAVGEDQDTVYTAGGDIALTYRFADTQAEGVKVSTDKLTLLVDDSTKTVAVATIDATTGKLQYQDTDEAKELLNKGDEVSNISAKVQIDAYYGSDKIPFENVSGNVITVDFYKPVYVTTAASKFEVKFDNTASLSSKNALAAMFQMKDAWGNDLFQYKDGKVTDNKGLYAFYDIKTIKVDFNNIKNVGGTTFSMEGATDNGDGTYTFDASTVAKLEAAMVVTTYPSDAIITNDTSAKFTITIEYYWGSQTTDVDITIKPNTAK
jgi:hypothetical protein